MKGRSGPLTEYRSVQIGWIMIGWVIARSARAAPGERHEGREGRTVRLLM
jgi:hypothetical protein